MSMSRFPFAAVARALAAALALSACAEKSDAPTTPAVPMPGLDYAIENSTTHGAARSMSHKTWLWTRGSGPAQIHYSTADGRDFAWLVGQRRIFQGEWKIDTTTDSSGQPLTQVCLRYPGVNVDGLSSNWTCQPAGTFFINMQQREGGDPLRISGRTQALFVITQTPANLAEIEARVAGSRLNLGY
ncbi:MAG: hypothetical protein Q8M19_09065 [Reyranella sp.]|nr:hypothetical protein [Reyranella sp.]